MRTFLSTAGVCERAMELRDVDRVLAVEASATEFPWTRGNFVDALAAGYEAEVLEDAHGELIGYHVSMVAVDEMHLLNLTVTPALQRHGWGRHLLERVIARARTLGLSTLWLEVRVSNLAAQSLYRRRGFVDVATRAGYYAGPTGQCVAAQVMRMTLGQS